MKLIRGTSEEEAEDEDELDENELFINALLDEVSSLRDSVRCFSPLPPTPADVSTQLYDSRFQVAFAVDEVRRQLIMEYEDKMLLLAEEHRQALQDKVRSHLVPLSCMCTS